MRVRALYVMGLLPAVLLAGVCVGGVAAEQKQDAAKISPEAAEFFESRIRPLLHKNCLPCHSDKAQMGNLRLDSLAAMLKGNSGGSVVVAGDPEKSPLIHVVRYDGKVKMPPAGKLKPAEIADLTQWVKMGAPWPGVKVSEAAKQAEKSGEYVITPEQKRFWSFQPVRKPSVPAVKNKAWVQTPIDAFVLAKLEAKGLQPAPRADRRTLIRRAYYDLTGLPPTIDDIRAFLNDKSPNAWEKFVDQLLSSPRYGERWGRHWLDIARYADTKGYVFVDDRTYYNAYTYRDWVIRAFNEDLPYDQFIIQQLAADRLDLGEDRRPLAAMGFLTVGRRFLNNPHDIIDDRIDVTMRGFQALTVNCARCHDHKFDPIPTKDYYALHGVFASSVESNPPPPISPPAISKPFDEQNRRIFDTEKQLNEAIQAQVRLLRQTAKNTPDALSEPIKKTLQGFRVGTLPNEKELAQLEPAFEPAAREQLKTLRETLANLRKTLQTMTKPELAMAMEDAPTPVTPHVLIRGNPNNPGPEIPRQYLLLLAGENRKPFTQGSGRLELAKAIASPDNPLTARVMVNRIWQNYFGYGIVRTASDFGTRGEPPTHPELLDWLAATFVEPPHASRLTPHDSATGAWSIKKMHRLILLSSAYQQGSDINPRAFTADPENRLLWHMNCRRLDLEALRDSLLYASGRLDLKLGGPSVDLTTAPFTTRRTVYGFIERQNLPGLFRTFDFASPDATTAMRFTTTVPQQALFLMNSPFMVEQVRALATRSDVVEAKDDAERIAAVYKFALARTPTPEEVKIGVDYLKNSPDIHANVALATKPDAKAPLTPWERYVQALLMTNEFTFVD